MSDNLIIINPLCGSRITDVIREAITSAEVAQATVQFTFNDVIVQVRADSAADLIYRDWSRAMAGYIDKTVGPYPTPALTPEEEASDARIAAENERRRQERRAQYEAEAAAKATATAAKLAAAPPMEFADEAAWQSWKASNTDPYGSGIIRYAEAWARLMQAEIADGAELEDIADSAASAADTGGVTGFMHGAAVHVLSKCWVHGDRLRKWHNKQWGVGEDATGTVNPAVITLKPKDSAAED